jgi:hypothetical protein
MRQVPSPKAGMLIPDGKFTYFILFSDRLA